MLQTAWKAKNIIRNFQSNFAYKGISEQEYVVFTNCLA